MLRIRKSVGVCLSMCLALGPVTSALAAGSVPASGYAACQTTDEQSFRQAIEKVTTDALQGGLAGVDYRAAVGDEWRKLEIGGVIDKQVDNAVEDVRNETSWGTLIRSLGNQDKARELTVAVAERVYRSDAMKTAIESLATGVGKTIGSRIEIATGDAAEPALQCLSAFLGPRYGSAIASVVAGNAGQEFAIDANKTGADVSPGSVLRQSAGGISGAAILVMRRQLGNMAARIGQRIAGSVLSRLVSVVAGGIGLVLIAKDVWDLRNGVLPIIAVEMKSKDTKDKVQDELAKTIAAQIGEHVKEIGALSADRIVAIWQEFRAAHAKILELSDRDAGFKTFLGTVKPSAIARLDEATSLVLAADGEAGLLKRAADGSLHQAVNVMPDAAMDIARQSRSLDQGLKWNAVAGDLITKVVEHDLFRRASPDDFTYVSLSKVIDLADPLAIVRMAGVGREARDVLFELEPAVLTTAARSLDEPQLESLAGYMTGLAREPRQRLLDAVATNPGRLQILSSNRVRNAVLSSRDQSAAVNMMLGTSDTANAVNALGDLKLAWDGRVNPVLLWEKHPLGLAILGGAIIVFLLLIRRLLRPRAAATAAKSTA